MPKSGSSHRRGLRGSAIQWRRILAIDRELLRQVGRCLSDEEMELRDVLRLRSARTGNDRGDPELPVLSTIHGVNALE
jgi:hypothetical protein